VALYTPPSSGHQIGEESFSNGWLSVVSNIDSSKNSDFAHVPSICSVRLSLSVLRLGLFPSNRCSVAPVEFLALEYSNLGLSYMLHLIDIKEAQAQLIESQIEDE